MLQLSRHGLHMKVSTSAVFILSLSLTKFVISLKVFESLKSTKLIEPYFEIDYMLHEYILALWGMPLGEMFDLEKLATTCREKNRWTFFVTSSPANCPGGISSHGNALAIF